MRINQTIEAAVLPVIPVCEQEQYAGEATEYVVYTYTRQPAGFGDNTGHFWLYNVTLHWWLPFEPGLSGVPQEAAVAAKLRQLLDNLEAFDFTKPSITPGGDEECMDIILECQWLGSDV